MSLLLRSLTALAAVSSLAACGDEGEGLPFSRPTLLSVEPEQLTGITCGDQPGQMRGYVATAWDTTPFDDTAAKPNADCEPSCGVYRNDGTFETRLSAADCWAHLAGDSVALPEGCSVDTCFVQSFVECDWFRLPSSDLVDCDSGVGFSFVAVGHEYVARVEGYERDDLVPRIKGHPTMTDPDTGQVVSPTWTWACTQPVVAVSRWDHPFLDCQLIHRSSGAVPGTGIEVDTTRLLGDELQCGDAADRVSRLEVTLALGDAVTESVPCGESARFDLGDGGETSYPLTVRAFATGSDRAGWETTCFADTRSGVVVEAQCDPLSTVR